VRAAVVFHRGALGDSVLTWPLLRTLALKHDEVALVSDLSKGRLAQRLAEPRVLALDAERREFVGLWHGGASGITPIDADLVIHLCATPADDAARAALQLWERGAKALYPTARVVMSAGVLDRVRALDLAKSFGRSRPIALRHTTSDSLIVHIGAGSSEKRWPLPLWRAMLAALRSHLPSRPIRIIAGEVELERLTQPEQQMFTAMGGEFISTLDDLASILESAGGFIGADSGPTHVAAAMGLPTLALFGPTDASRWAPLGPMVRVLAPPEPRGMAWLNPAEVAAAGQGLFSGNGGFPPDR
jgi:hypothetical protein